MMEKISLSKYYIITLLVVVFFAVAFAFLEYNYILYDAIPFREAKPPAIANLYGYDLLVFLPALFIFSFYPLINQVLQKGKQSLRRPIAFGVACLLTSIVLKDAAWYMFRALFPVTSDPLAYQWIRSSDYTANLLGFADFVGFRIPLWYIALSPLIVAIFISLIINQNTLQKEDNLSNELEETDRPAEDTEIYREAFP